jgi:hypothetical protein
MMPDGFNDNRPPGRRRLTALLEVVLLLAVTLIAVGLASHSPWGARYQAVHGRPFLEYLVMMAVPVGVLLLSGRRPFAFGLLSELFAGNLAPDWRGGLTSAVWGLFFGYLREWSGSIVAPALVHGLPQGIASALLGR